MCHTLGYFFGATMEAGGQNIPAEKMQKKLSKKSRNTANLPKNY